MGNCHPEKTNVDGGEADILLNVNEIHRQHYVKFPNLSCQVNI